MSHSRQALSSCIALSCLTFIAACSTSPSTQGKVPIGATSGKSGAGTSPVPTGWKTPTSVSGFILNGQTISCAGPTFCMAVEEHDRALVYNGNGWSPSSSPPGIIQLESVSCPTTSFCLVVGVTPSTDDSATFNGKTWSGPSTLPIEPNAVSCTSPKFCAAVGQDATGDGVTATFDGTSWTSSPATNAGPFASVSCPSSLFCIAVGPNVFTTYDGSSWSSPAAFMEFNLSGVACATPTFCMGVGESSGLAGSQSATFNGLSWAPSKTFASDLDVASVSCPTSSFCMATTGVFGATTAGASFNGAQWSGAISGLGGLSNISCPRAGFCVAGVAEANYSSMSYVDIYD